MSNPIILCGMYAFSTALQNVWKDLFKSLYQLGAQSPGRTFDIRYQSTKNDFRISDLYLGHTCGYPFWHDFLSTHEVITVPEFAVDGCSGLNYSSWIMARANDSRGTLEDFRNSVAIINCSDSNSGMNVFRHEVSRIASGSRFFRDVKISGSHLKSMLMIRDKIGDIAAIDAVSFGLAKHLGEIDPSEYKILLQTQSTPGLPFIAHRQHELDAQLITAALNEGLANLPKESSELLPIRQFSCIDSGIYHRIMELEDIATKLGYPEIA